MKASRLIIYLALIAFCCDKPEPAPDNQGDEAAEYVDELLDIMEKNSINRKTIDWTAFKAKVKAKAEGSVVISDTYVAIAFALKELGDNHSFYTYDNGTKAISGSSLVCKASPGPVTPVAGIGYLKVLGFSGNQEQANSFANALHVEMRNQDKIDLKGWIVDLRSNTGGNMWPMIAGIGPVLGDGVCGYFIDPDNNEGKWEYKNGQSLYNGAAINTVTGPYNLFKANPKVAVLLSQQTGSSGEAVVVAFTGRSNTKFFGTSTCGVPTANASFPLSDGATLVLTVSNMADRNKNKIAPKPIAPDVAVEGDAVVTKAIEWLNEP